MNEMKVGRKGLLNFSMREEKKWEKYQVPLKGEKKY
jgi:hypothetical protein